MLNDTPHSINAPPLTLKELSKPKPPPVPMSEKVERLVQHLRQNPTERLLLAKGRFQYATTGKPISLAVARAAYKAGKIRCLDAGGLFPGYAPSKLTAEIAGQTWALA